MNIETRRHRDQSFRSLRLGVSMFIWILSPPARQASR
jgi:hypothetical protein